MRTDTPVPVKLSDYRPYPFAIERVALIFDLEPGATRVRSVMQVRRTGPGDMVLDGVGLELKSLAIEGDPVPPSGFTCDDETLTLHDVPDAFRLEILVTISPQTNTALSGLYMSGGRFCTQCEADGFRRITYWPDRPDVMSRFHVRLEADKGDYPILLSNGTPGASGDLGAGRHFAEWDDPHPKPSYLFALCAGDYDVHEDSFTTRSGAPVELAIHVDKGDGEQAAFAMESLKAAMAWDEAVFGREYDLGRFNIVAVRDFNFGAMENKGLNIFNSAYVLADEATATDADFEAIESIVAHEYFHNWTGNRITCRDWFQLCLKEGLTVFRDQEFSADMRSRPVQRIKDVIRLRARQFPEDAGPLAHPVRPDSYASVDNLYTATVYEKGAELIRMLKALIGEAAFARGMDIYFERHDGDAATIEDFYACFEAASGRDLAAFRRWYAQAGTPQVRVEEAWEPGEGRLKVRLSQTTPPTPGQPDKLPVPIPLAAALLDGEGGEIEAEGWPLGERMLVLDTTDAEFTVDLGAGASRPILSINRGFSAPVRVRRGDESFAVRLARASAETDPFNRWDGLQSLMSDDLLAIAYDGADSPDARLVAALAGAIEAAADSDPAFAALLARVPELGGLFLEREPAAPQALERARGAMRRALAEALQGFIGAQLSRPTPAPFRPDAEQSGVRALRSALTDLRAELGPQSAADLKAQFDDAQNMTESLAALRALARLDTAETRAVLEAFYARWKDRPLVLDKWFAAQALVVDADGARELAGHRDFDLGNPNRVRALAGVFAMQNLGAFHAPDGSGYAFLADIAMEADKRNPALAARLLTAFEQWRKLEPEAREKAFRTLEGLAGAGLSRNAADIVGRGLAAAG